MMGDLHTQFPMCAQRVSLLSFSSPWKNALEIQVFEPMFLLPIPDMLSPFIVKYQVLTKKA